MTDYVKLAQQFGGSIAEPTPAGTEPELPGGVNYASIAAEFGGTVGPVTDNSTKVNIEKDMPVLGSSGIKRFNESIGKDRSVTERLTAAVFGDTVGGVVGGVEDFASAPAMFAAHVLVKPVVDTLEDIAMENIIEPVGEFVAEQIPDPVKQHAKDIINNVAKFPQYQGAFQAIGDGVEATKKYAKEHPKDAARVAGLLTLAEFVPGGKAGEVAVREAKDILADTAEVIARRSPEKIDNDIISASYDALKSVKPGNKNLRTAKKRVVADLEFDKKLEDGKFETIKGPEAYKAHMASFMESVVDNKEKLNITDFDGVKVDVPTDLKSAFEAEMQLEDIFFKEFDDLVVSSATKNGRADYTDLVVRLRKLKSDKAGVWNPEHLDAIDDKIEYILDQGSLDLKTAQSRLAILNNKVGNSAANKEFMDAGTNAVDAIEADYLRGTIDKVVSNMEGPGWAEARRKYGSLMVVRDDLANKYSSLAKQTKGEIGVMFDAFADTHIALGLATQNPSQFLLGAIPKTERAFAKKMKDPNNLMNKAFKKVDKAIEIRKRLPGKMRPRSAVGKLASIGSEYIDNGLKNIMGKSKSQSEYTESLRAFADDLGEKLNIMPKQITHEATRFPVVIEPNEVIDWLVETAKTQEGRDMIRRKLGAHQDSLPPGIDTKRLPMQGFDLGGSSGSRPVFDRETGELFEADFPSIGQAQDAEKLAQSQRNLGTKDLPGGVSGTTTPSERQRLTKLLAIQQGKEVPMSRPRRN